MDSHQIKQHLTDLVLDGREEVAIEELLAMSSSRNMEIRNNIAGLSSRYQKFERERIKGSLNKEHINNTSGRISQALMAIIEQLTEDDESSLQKVDLEGLFKDIDEMSINTKLLPKVKSGKSRPTRILSIIVPVVILVIVGILAFSGKFSSTTNSGNALGNWVGEWQHQMQSANDSKITGTLSFQLINNELTGKAKNVFPPSGQAPRPPPPRRGPPAR